MKLPSQVRFADEKIKNALTELREGKTTDQQLYEFVIRAFEDIEKNAFCGIQIPKKLIPKEYSQKYGVRNLWKYNLPAAWRLMYTIEKEEILVISIVLEWMTHKEYDRRFNY